MSKDSDLITLQQAIREFKLGRTTMFRAMDSGELKRYRRGGDKNVYLSRKAITEWRTFREEKS